MCAIAHTIFFTIFLLCMMILSEFFAMNDETMKSFIEAHFCLVSDSVRTRDTFDPVNAES